MRPALARSASLWPTPTATDAKASGASAGYPSRRHGTGHAGTTLVDAGVRNWPTPTAADAGRASRTYARGEGNPTLLGMAALWPTPTADPFRGRGGERRAEVGLLRQASAWPTPAASDGKRAVSPDERDRTEGATLSATVSRSFLPDPPTAPAGNNSSRSTRVLNPRFVCLLMSLPIGWDDAESPLAWIAFESWATASSRLLRRLRS